MFTSLSRPLSRRSRNFLNGFVSGALIVVLLNLLAIHLRSDAGISALIGGCYDCTLRAGFPWLVLESGGFVNRSHFDPQALFHDVLVGVGIWIACGFLAAQFLDDGPDVDEAQLWEDSLD